MKFNKKLLIAILIIIIISFSYINSRKHKVIEGKSNKKSREEREEEGKSKSINNASLITN